MSVLKVKWSDIQGYFPFDDYLGYSIFQELLEEVDEEFIDKIGEFNFEPLASTYSEMADDYLANPNTSLWKDMPIFVSSYKVHDARILNELQSRLLQYIGFYRRILIDDGVARKLVTHRTFSGSGSSSGTYKNYESDTPQMNLTNFDDAIDYATRLEKNTDSRSSSKEGETDYELKSFNWDEALKNMKMVFYNDLVRYINSIPVLIYNYYALDQYPVTESVKEYINYLKTLRDIYAH